MTFNEYKKLAARTINRNLDGRQKLHHALFELSAEVGEISSIFQKSLQGHVIDRKHVVEEIGDVLWGLAELCDVFGFDMDMVAQENISKLKRRYPDPEGFREERSVNRDC